MQRFNGRVALVTGGTSGIGRAAALAFAAEGASVVIAGRRLTQGAAVVTEIRRTGGEATFVCADVRHAESTEALVRTAVERYGKLDFAFNNAGIAGLSPRRTEDQTEEAWTDVIDTNLKGVWLSMKYELREMTRQGAGAIVNNASDVGLVGSAIGISPYVASKHGVVGLTRAAALEHAAAGIRVNAICPGFTTSEMTAPVLAMAPETLDRLVRNHTPLGRIAHATEIARAALWLCSDEAAFVTGTALSIDGGSTAR